MKYSQIILIIVLILTDVQITSAQTEKDPRGAFLRSMVVPGWGHYYNDSVYWNRGKFHLTTEMAIIAVYIGLQHRSSTLRNEFTTLANLRSGVSIDGRNRSFQIALADFSSLEAYNDFQLRSRNWSRLIEVNSSNNWKWHSDTDRIKYGELRSRRDRIRSQLPALFGLMVINRVVSAVSAYNRASHNTQGIEIALLPVLMEGGSNGAITKIRYSF